MSVCASSALQKYNTWITVKWNDMQEPAAGDDVFVLALVISVWALSKADTLTGVLLCMHAFA
jgi:hypothetical protein